MKNKITPSGNLIYPLDIFYWDIYQKRIKNDSHKIYRFDCYPSVDTQKGRTENWKRAELINEFKRNLITKFSSYSHSELVSKLFMDNKNWEYYAGSTFFDPMEVGFDILFHEKGILNEKQWGYWYIAIPIQQIKIIEFIEIENLYFMKTKKRLP